MYLKVYGTVFAADLGQRAFVGKVNMNQNSPEFYCESTADSLRDTEMYSKAIACFYLLVSIIF